MRDEVASTIVHYALSIKWDDLDEDIIREVKRRILDSLGVALAAYAAEPVRIARRVAKGYPSLRGGTLWGSGDSVAVDWAIFVNSLMVRYLDYNDTYLSKEPLHPSDTIPSLVSFGEYSASNGKDLITAIAISYEIGVRLCDSGSLRMHGWDHVNYITIASVSGMSRLARLDEVKALNALSIATVPHAAMRQSRVGELSHWKAAATANSSRNAAFAVLLASEGFTGPDAPLRGEMGFIKQLLANEFDEGPIMGLSSLPKPRRILDTYIKPYPVEYHAQSAVDAAKQVRHEYGKPIEPQDVDYIIIDTFKAAYDIIVKDPQKWDPRTKETADHSLMWVTATALLHGTVELLHYMPENIRDPRILGLIKKMKVNVDPELDKLYPSAIPNRVTVRFTDGREITSRVDYPRGHPRNPMSDEEIRGKFMNLTRVLLGEEQARKLMSIVDSLEDLNSLNKLVRFTVI